MKRILKNFIIILIMLSMHTTSFSAIVSDNDGSAFVTKAEFETLKKSFQSQVNDYNLSIDGKIDGAIASYLSGINLNTPSVDLLAKVNESVGGKLYFKNSWPGYGSSSLTTAIKVDITRHYTYLYFSNLIWSAKASWYNYITGAALMAGWTGSGSTATANNRLGYNEFNGSRGPTYFTYNSLSSGYTWESNNVGKLSTDYSNVTNTYSYKYDGAGSGWVSETKPSGRKILKQYCSEMYPTSELEVVTHTYKSCAPSKTTSNVNTYSVSSGGYGDNQTLSEIIIPQITNWGVKTVGTKILTSDDTTDLAQYYNLVQLMVKTNDGIDYSVFMWGANASKTLYHQDENIKPTVNTTATSYSAATSKSTFKRISYTAYAPSVSDNTLSGQAVSYYRITSSTTSAVSNQVFSNDYVSTIAGQDVKIDGGIPIIETTSDERNVSLKLKFHCSKYDTTSKARTTQNDTVYYKVSDMPFKNNAVDTANGAKTLASGSIASGTFTPDISFMKDDKGIIWLTCYAATSGVDVDVDTMEFK